MLAALVWGRLRSHAGRSLVLVATIAVTSGIALSALAVRASTADPWERLFQATNGADVVIELSRETPDREALAATPGVETVGLPIEGALAALHVRDEGMLVWLQQMPDRREDMVVDRPVLTAGRWFEGPEEVVLEATLADALDVEVGDRFALTGGRATRTIRVAGLAATTMRPNFPESTPGSIFTGATIYDALGPVDGPRWTTPLRLRDPARAAEVVAGIPGARTAADIRANAFPATAKESAAIMLFFAALMVITSAVLLVTLLGSRLVSEARELTLLQVAGLTPARLALLVATENGLLALAGVLAGLPIAAVLAPRIAGSAATVLGSVSPVFTGADIAVVGVVAVAFAAGVSAIAGWRLGARSLAVVARGGAGIPHRSRAAGTALALSAPAALVLALKDLATRRGRAAAAVLTVALAVTMAVAIVGIGTMPTASLGQSVRTLPSRPAATTEEIRARLLVGDLSGRVAAVNDDIVSQVVDLVTLLQVLLGIISVMTLLAAASMSLRERRRELAVLHALGCSTRQLTGAAALGHGVLASLGATLGVPLGIGLYLALTVASGAATDTPPLVPIALAAIIVVLTATAAASIPALLVQRTPTPTALATE